MAISDKGSGGGRPDNKVGSRGKKIKKHFTAGLKPAKKDWSTSGNTEVKKKYKPLPGEKKKKSYPNGTSNGYRSVGTSGGSTSGAKHNPNTGGFKGGAGGKGRGGRGGHGGGGGGRGITSNKKLMKQAKRYINKDIENYIDALQREKRAQHKDYRFNVNELESLYNRAKGDLTHVFGEANEQNALQTQAMLDRIMGTKADTTQQFDQLLSTQQGNTQQNQADLMAELSRLGVQQGADLGQFAADANFAQAMGQQSGANAQANLNMMSQSAGDIGSLLGQTANSSLAANIGRQLNLKNENIAEALHNYRGNVDDIFGEMRAARKERGNRVYDMYRDLEQTNYDRWFQNREANRANKLGWSNFNLAASGQNADLMFQKAAMLQEQRQQAAYRRAQERQARAFQNGGGGGGYNPMSDILW